MQTPRVRFDGVWKKFRKGEVHDSLRDLIPAVARGILGRTRDTLDSEDDFWALQNVDFVVEPGEALGIIGPNGAGKSTALKLLARILQPTRGSVSIEGRVGALIEVAAGFHPDLTGRENVYLQGAIMGMPQRDIRKRFDEIVAFSGVEEFIDTPVKRYSSGMNARLGFSISAHLDPDVLLIDEVLSVGDLAFQQRCHDRLQEIRGAGTPIVFVSHNLNAVAGLCSRALLLRRGAPPELGDVQETLRLYTQASFAGADERIEVVSTAIVQDDGTPVTGSVSPGNWLRLDVELAIHHSIGPAGASLVVHRSDNVLIFDGIVTPEPGDLVDLLAGTRLNLSIRFRANLLGGVFSVGLVLFDERRLQPYIRIPGLANFHVQERDRSGGSAELEPTAQLSLRPDPNHLAGSG